MTAQYQTVLCSVCRSVLCAANPPTLATETLTTIEAAEQTFETFHEAVRDKCVICSVIWDLSYQYRNVWSKSPELWEQMRYTLRKGRHNDNVINLTVFYKKPRKDVRVAMADMAEFLLIARHETKFQEQLAFPTLPHNVQFHDLLAIARRWLSQCQSSHFKCNQSLLSAHKWHPTRLLDIGDDSSPSWRLRVVAEDGIPSLSTPYLTLSYRWAQKPEIRLLSSNIESFRSGRPISDLPILFQEFILIAKHFSVRYIWIDALCIIQDSEKDWNTEAPTMHLVYSGSTCNIAASHSADSSESLFHSRDMNAILPGLTETSLFSNEPHASYIFDRGYWDRQISYGSLHNRGWVFQERFLAPRVLYFGKNQLLWECRNRHRCEVFPEGIPHYYSHKETDALLETSTIDDTQNPGMLSEKMINFWSSIVEKYSRCDLTYPSDRLLAIAGIAKLFQRATNDRYLAGLWSSQLLPLMDWGVWDPRPRQASQYKAPSWSWASVDGPISMSGHSPSTRLLVELLNAEISTKFPDEMSTVLDGFVMLKGRLRTIVVLNDSPPFVNFRSEIGEFTVQVHPDTLDVKFAENRCFYYVPFKLDYIHGENGGKTPYVVCLMLEETDRTADPQIQYRRIGRFTSREQKMIDSIHTQDEIQIFKVV